MSDTSGNDLEREFECYAAITQAEELLKLAMDIPQALNSITRAADLAERVRNIAKKAQNIELVEVMTELRIELANSKNSLADATEEVASLKNRNRDLEAKVENLEKASQEKLILKNNAYYTEGGTDPICVTCYDTKKQKVHLVSHGGVGSHEYRCGHCKNVVRIGDNPPQKWPPQAEVIRG